MSEQPIDATFRSAYQALLDDAPQAPDWEDIAVPVYRPVRVQPKRLPRWAGALVLATILVLMVGGVAWFFSGDRAGTAPSDTAAPDPAIPTHTSAPAPTSPPSTAAGTVPTTNPRPSPSSVPTEGDAVELVPGPDRVFASSSLEGYPPEATLDRDLSTAWNDDSRQGVGAKLTFIFDDPVQLEGIILMNLDEEDRFLRNYRVATYQIVINGNLAEPIGGNLPDARGELLIPLGSTAVRTLQFEVLGVYEAEPFENSPPFNELAIAEMRFFGHRLVKPVEPVPPASTAGIAERLRQPPDELDLGNDVIVTDIDWTGAFYSLSGSAEGRAALWISRDGASWERNQIPAREDEVIIDISTHSELLIAVTAQTGAIEGGDGGIWRSGDGIEWQRMTTVPSPIGEPVEYAPGHLGAPTRGSFINREPGLLISRTSGRSWSHLPFEAEGATERTVITDLASASGRTIAVGRLDLDAAGLWYSGDPAGPWTRVGNDPELRRLARLDAAAATEDGFWVAGVMEGGPAVGWSFDALSWSVEALPLSAVAQRSVRVLVGDMVVTPNGLAIAWGEAAGDSITGILWASAGNGDWLVFDLGPVVSDGVHVAVADRHIAVVTTSPDGTVGIRIADR